MCIPMPYCLIGGAIGGSVDGAIERATNSAIDRLADSVSEAVVRVLASLATAWVETPTPSAAQLFHVRGSTGSGSLPIATPSPAVEFAQTLMLPVTLGIMVVALTVAGIRMIIAGQRAGEEGRRILVGLVSMVAISSLGLLGFTLLIQASDATASWILDNAIDNTAEGMANGFSIVFQALLAGAAANGSAGVAVATFPSVLVIVGGIVLLLISFVQIILMILRGGMLVVMAGLLPTVAAAATTQTGMEWLQRYIRWSFALILFKPIAALVYAICFKMLVVGDEATGDEVINVVTGLGLLFLACMALPALMRIIAPAASAIAGNAGGIVVGAAAGAAAVGAMAVPALAGGGAAAAAGGGAQAKGAVGSAGTGGPSGGGDDPSPSGGGSAPTGGEAAVGSTASSPSGGGEVAVGSAPSSPSGGSEGSTAEPANQSSSDAPRGSGGTTSGSNLLGMANAASTVASTAQSTVVNTAEGATEEPKRD